MPIKPTLVSRAIVDVMLQLIAISTRIKVYTESINPHGMFAPPATTFDGNDFCTVYANLLSNPEV